MISTWSWPQQAPPPSRMALLSWPQISRHPDACYVFMVGHDGDHEANCFRHANLAVHR